MMYFPMFLTHFFTSRIRVLFWSKIFWSIRWGIRDLFNPFIFSYLIPSCTASDACQISVLKGLAFMCETNGSWLKEEIDDHIWLEEKVLQKI